MEVSWPKGWEWLGAPIGVIGALLLGIPIPFWVLLGLQLLDIVSGIGAAIKLGEGVSSRSMQLGLLAKGETWAIVSATWMLALVAPPEIQQQLGLIPSAALASAFAVKEFLSVLENALRGGAQVPDVVHRIMNPALAIPPKPPVG